MRCSHHRIYRLIHWYIRRVWIILCASLPWWEVTASSIVFVLLVSSDAQSIIHVCVTGIITSILRHSFHCRIFHIDRFAARINHDLALLSLLLRFINDTTTEVMPTTCFLVCCVSINLFETTANVTAPPSKMDSAWKTELSNLFICCRETLLL